MLEKKYSSFNPLIVWAIIAALCYVISKYSPFPEWLLLFFVLVSIILLSFILVSLVDWIVLEFLETYRQFKKAKEITKISLIMEHAKYLNKEQLELVFHAQEVIKQRFIPGNAGPVRVYVTGENQEITQAFIDEFFSKCDEMTLCPVREYNDSRAREQAIALTSMLCNMGLAIPGSGNQRATWIEPFEKVKQYFGVER